MIISCDVETRSAADLKTQGAYKYFDDPEADVLVLCYSVDGGTVETWWPNDPVPECFHTGDQFTAWNASFERLAFSKILTPKYGFPEIPLERWFCTAYQSRCNNAPSALGNAARFLHTKDQKDPIGERLIRSLCIKQAAGSWNNDPVEMELLGDYCRKDVLAEMAIAHQLRQLTADELKDWHVNEAMNDNGIMVDVDLCRAAMKYAKEEEQDLLDLVADVTQGDVVKIRGPKMKAWILERLTREQVELITDKGKTSMDKRAREKLLGEDIPADVRTVIECADAIGKSSVGKFRAMRNRASGDSRVRGVMVAAGAAQTGRASSMGIQIQNFPRETAKEPLAIRADLLANMHPEELVDKYDSKVMNILSSMLRPTLMVPEGHLFLDCDYSSIENRVGPWLTDSPEGEAKLDQFRNGVDPYLVAASDIYGREIKKGEPERQVGKVAELSLGYGGGVGAFSAMARGYGVSLPESEVRDIVQAWRLANRWAVDAWEGLDIAFTKALRNPETEFSYGRIKYYAMQDILAGGTTVFCELPCGRYLTYPDVRTEFVGFDREVTTFARANWTPKSGERVWPRSKIWGGTLFENVTQAAAASLMRYALRRVTDAGGTIVAAVHDQMLMEVPIEEEARWTAVLHEAMNTAPDWADGLPVEAEVETRTRFGK